MHFMNKQHGMHMGAKPEAQPADDMHQESGQHETPQIHIHSHDSGHTVHIMHANGQHEMHDHEQGDSDGIASLIHQHIGKEGQDHGGASGEEMENEESYGGPGV